MKRLAPFILAVIAWPAHAGVLFWTESPPPVEPRTWTHTDLDVKPAAKATIVIGELSHELPAELLGYNLQHLNFQAQLFPGGKPAPIVVESLKALPGGLCRYPGGTLSNRFSWEDAVGPERGVQAVNQSAVPRRVTFGPAEFLALVAQLGCTPTYTLNLAGWHPSELVHELPVETMAASNAQLAKLIGGKVNIYQLGNELDRAEYQWPNDKYVARSRATIDAIKAVDPDARFVAFLRDFDWTYKAPLTGKSKWQDLMRDALTGLPDVTDFSLQYYYDDPGLETVATKNIQARLRLFQTAMEEASKHRGGKALGLWVTEHARGVNIGAGDTVARADVTSNLAAAVSTGDFLIGLAQLPDVRGAALWGANAGPWQIFDATIEHKDLRPRPVYWALRVLRSTQLSAVLRTITSSPNTSGYSYDVRAVGFAADVPSQPGGPALGVWAVNRALAITPITITYAPLAGKAVTIARTMIAGVGDPDSPNAQPVVEIEPVIGLGQFSADGLLPLSLPASSVSSFTFTPAP